MTTPTEQTKDLTSAMEKMREKSRSLNDTLKTLTEEGFEKLSRAAKEKPRGGGRDGADIARSALGQTLQREMAAEMQNIFRNLSAGGRESGVSIVVNNNAAVQVSATERTDAMDKKYLEITIDQMVANSLLRGRQTSGVMRTLFGLAPSLLGR